MSRIEQPHSNYAHKIRNEFKRHEEQISELRKNLEKQEQKAKLDGRVNLEKVKTENDIKLQEEIIKHEQRLQKLKDDFSKTQETLASEEDQLRTVHENKLAEQDTDFMERFQFRNFSNQSHIRNQNAAHLEAEQQLLEKHKNALTDTTIQQNKDYSNLRQTNREKVFQEQATNRDLLFHEQQRFDNYLNDKRFEFEKNKTQLETKQNKDLSTTKTEHQKTYQHEIKRQESMMKQAKDDFKRKYDEMKRTQSEMLKNLKDVFKARINETKNKFTEEKKLIDTKYEDTFYRTNELTPIIKDTEKHYEISFKLPEHEQNLINLSGQNRKLKITFSRSHIDKGFNDDGTYKNTSKAENITKEFLVPEIINAKEIEKYPSDLGITFKIAKL